MMNLQQATGGVFWYICTSIWYAIVLFVSICSHFEFDMFNYWCDLFELALSCLKYSGTGEMNVVV